MNQECEEIKEILTLYSQGKLTQEQKQKLNQHVLFCSDCMYQMMLAPDLARSF